MYMRSHCIWCMLPMCRPGVKRLLEADLALLLCRGLRPHVLPQICQENIIAVGVAAQHALRLLAAAVALDRCNAGNFVRFRSGNVDSVRNFGQEFQIRYV